MCVRERILFFQEKRGNGASLESRGLGDVYKKEGWKEWHTDFMQCEWFGV